VDRRALADLANDSQTTFSPAVRVLLEEPIWL
jgi:hypothetical protein